MVTDNPIPTEWLDYNGKIRTAWEASAMHMVQLTPAQAKHVAWALDPMEDLWCTEQGGTDRGGFIYAEHDLPQLKGEEVAVSHVPMEILDDLRYRLLVQIQDMASEEGVTAVAAIRAWDRIEKSMEER